MEVFEPPGFLHTEYLGLCTLLRINFNVTVLKNVNMVFWRTNFVNRKHTTSIHATQPVFEKVRSQITS